MKHLKTVVTFVVIAIVVGACAYLGYMIADTEIDGRTEIKDHASTNSSTSHPKQNYGKIIAAVGGGVFGLSVIAIIYGLIKQKEEKVSFRTDREVLSRFSRLVPAE